jgi:hypothetical protein
MPFTQPASFYRRKIYETIQFDYINYKVSGDLDFFIRISKNKNIKFKYFNNVLAIFFKDGNSFGDKNYSISLQELNYMGANPNFIIRILFYVFRKIC